jgi:hypothetical protein
MCQCCHKLIIYINLNRLCHIRLSKLFFEEKKSEEFGTESWELRDLGINGLRNLGSRGIEFGIGNAEK